MNTNQSTSIGEIEARNVYRCTSLVIRSEPRKRDAFERTLVQTWGASDAAEWSVGCGRCKVCGASIDDTPTVVFVAGADLTLPCNVCDDCMEIVRDHYSQQGPETEDVTTTPNWDRDCPPRFRDAVLADELPPRVDRDANARVMRWDSASMRGPLMTGAPGTGKTTTFWALARKLEQAGHSPKCLSSVELGRILSNAAKDIREVSWLYNSRVLMIDDLGKEKLILFYHFSYSNNAQLLNSTNFVPPVLVHFHSACISCVFACFMRFLSFLSFTVIGQFC